MKKIQNNVKIRKFTLYNYNELKLEAAENNQNGEYIKALSVLSNKNIQTLVPLIQNSESEVKLAHLLTGIE